MKKLSIHRPVVMIKQGFTLIEALIVIVLIGLLAGLLVSTFNPNASKGTILFNNTVQLRDAMKRATLDFNGYPAPGVAGSLRVLFDNSDAIQIASNYAARSLPRNWKGPYIEAMPVNGVSPIFADIGANTNIGILPLAALAGGPYDKKSPFILSVAAVPAGIAIEAVRSCLNIGSNTTSGGLADASLIGYNPNFAVGSCRLTGGTATTTTAFEIVVGL